MAKYLSPGYTYKDCPACGRAGCEAPYVMLHGDSKVRTGPWECDHCGWDSEEVDDEKGYEYYEGNGVESPPTVGTILSDMLDVVTRPRR